MTTSTRHRPSAAVNELIRYAGIRRGGDLAQAMRAAYTQRCMAGVWDVVRATGDAYLATDLRQVWRRILAERRAKQVALMDARIAARRATR